MEQVVGANGWRGYAGEKEDGILQGPCGPWQGFWVLFYRNKFSSTSPKCFSYLCILVILCQVAQGGLVPTDT